mgnify:CR=1 FL=1
MPIIAIALMLFALTGLLIKITATREHREEEV